MPGEGELVSVVVPAYNAEATIDATLESVRAQTYRNLEILVVDDGSSDRTAAIAATHAAADPRVGVLTTPNGGVAAARNIGIAETRGALIAAVDADDLWHPTKIARQVDRIGIGGPDMAYVYTGFRQIRLDGSVMGRGTFHDCQGEVFLRSVFSNFVGNGSALLFRRGAIEEVGGYEPELHRLGFQGAEDRLVQTLMARIGTVGAVLACLTGYRQVPGAMSKNRLRMLHSQLTVVRMVAERIPEAPTWVLDAARAQLEIRTAKELMQGGTGAQAISYFNRAIGHDARVARTQLRIELSGIRHRAQHRFLPQLRNVPEPAPRHFYDIGPEEGIKTVRVEPYKWLHDRIAANELPVRRPAG